jgi:hypothetical protein
MKPKEEAALERLIAIAQGTTGQSRRVADFLLAWWNSGDCGGFDLTTLWGIDDAIAGDMVTVFGYIARVKNYPDTLGYKEQFESIVREWRPELLNGVNPTLMSQAAK